jgi:hypothetical protein
MLHAQAFAKTDISDLAHLTSTRDDEDAARTLKEAWRFMRLEQQVCEQRRPGVYFVMNPNNRWAFPALWLVDHKHILVSAYNLSQHLKSGACSKSPTKSCNSTGLLPH